METGMMEKQLRLALVCNGGVSLGHLPWVTFIFPMMDQHYPRSVVHRRLREFGFWRLAGAVEAWRGDEPMLKWISAALALICIATFAWMHLEFRPTECTKWLDGECIRVEIIGAR
jgi:hypothetical protein